MTSFTAAAIQSNVTMVDSQASARAIKKQRDANLDRALLMIEWILKNRYPSVWADEPSPPLIGIPESFLHSFPRAEGAQIKNMQKVAISIPGEETDKIAAKAKKYGAYIFAAAYENDPDWPGRYFNTGFIIDPRGEIVLKYRKIDCGRIETGTSPHEVFDEYIERYGYDALFPVIDTPIGRLGMMICADGLFCPEVPRVLAMKGAEVICYPISTTQADHHYYHLTAQARAIDNACYVVSPNLGMTYSDQRPHCCGGESLICDFEGRILSKAAASGETTVHSILHLDALRRYRLRTRFGACSIRSELYAPAYEQSFVPPNFFLDEPEQDLSDELRLRDATYAKLFADGVYISPNPEKTQGAKKSKPPKRAKPKGTQKKRFKRKDVAVAE